MDLSFKVFNYYHDKVHLKNVELPLTYAGVSKKERRERAILALERVGLKDRIHFQAHSIIRGTKTACGDCTSDGPIIQLFC